MLPARFNISLSDPINLISLGDSHLEKEATKELGKKFETAAVKVVKLMGPIRTPNMLKQITLVNEFWQRILTSNTSRDFTIEKKS